MRNELEGMGKGKVRWWGKKGVGIDVKWPGMKQEKGRRLGKGIGRQGNVSGDGKETGGGRGNRKIITMGRVHREKAKVSLT